MNCNEWNKTSAYVCRSDQKLPHSRSSVFGSAPNYRIGKHEKKATNLLAECQRRLAPSLISFIQQLLPVSEGAFAAPPYDRLSDWVHRFWPTLNSRRTSFIHFSFDLRRTENINSDEWYMRQLQFLWCQRPKRSSPRIEVSIYYTFWLGTVGVGCLHSNHDGKLNAINKKHLVDHQSQIRRSSSTFADDEKHNVWTSASHGGGAEGKEKNAILIDAPSDRRYSKRRSLVESSCEQYAPPTRRGSRNKRCNACLTNRSNVNAFYTASFWC